ncbi:MAG: glycosyltransferase family 87 protein [Janthinobacterium lividum]
MFASRWHCKANVLLALLLISQVFTATASRLFGHFATQNGDFYVYYAAARVVHQNPRADLFEGATGGEALSGTAPYASPLAIEARHAGIEGVLVYLYPPLLADLLTPISAMPAHAAAATWKYFNYILLFLVALYIQYALGFKRNLYIFLTLLIGTVCYFPVVEAIAYGQITIVLLLLWTIAVVAYGRGQTIVCALALALATALKITPILMLPLFLIWKDRRWLLTYLAGTTAFFVLMLLINGESSVMSTVSVMKAVGSSMPSLGIKTLSALPLEAWILWHIRSLGSHQSGRPGQLLFVIGRAIAAAFYAVCLYVVWRRRAISTKAERAGTLALFATVSLLASPVAWRHAYTVFLLPLAELWKQATSELGTSIDLRVIVAASFFTGSVLSEYLVNSHVPFALRLIAEYSWVVTGAWLCLRALNSGFAFVTLTGVSKPEIKDCTRSRKPWRHENHNL